MSVKVKERLGAMRWGPVPGQHGGTAHKWLPIKSKTQRPIGVHYVKTEEAQEEGSEKYEKWMLNV